MAESNQKLQPTLIFPENSASIIENILKKYGLEESDEELLEKWGRNEKSQGEILVDLVMSVLKTNLPISELINLTQKGLNIPKQKAEKIIEDLTKEIIAPATQLSKKIPSIGELLSLRE